MLCKPNQTHLPATSLQPLSNPYILHKDMRLGEVKGCAMAMMRLDGRVGRAKGPSFPNQIMIPELQRSISLLKWKLVKICGSIGNGSSVLFSPWLPLLPLVKLNEVKADADKGAKSTGLFIPFRQFSCPSQTHYHWLFYSPPSLPFQHRLSPLEWD